MIDLCFRNPAVICDAIDSIHSIGCDSYCGMCQHGDNADDTVTYVPFHGFILHEELNEYFCDEDAWMHTGVAECMYNDTGVMPTKKQVEAYVPIGGDIPF